MTFNHLPKHHSLFRSRAAVCLALLGSQGCAGGDGDPNAQQGSGGSSFASGGESSGVDASGGVASSSGGQAAQSSGGASSGGASSGGASSGSGGSGPNGSGGVADAAGGAPALESFASDLDGLFIDAACSTGTTGPLADGATCGHLDDEWRIEKKVTFGGETGTKYRVTLRVRGIWEPTDIDGGTEPDMDVPFMVGGDVKGGSGSSSDAINYQQYFISVSSPKQTYWLNNHNYLAHDIHKVDYEAIIEVDGGAELDVVMNDGNERQIANFTKDLFDDMPPYDQAPTLGQLLQLEVIKVEIAN